MSPLFGTGLRLKVTSSAADELVHHEPPNLHIINAALSVCEKGGAWVEALSLYENIRAMENHENSTKPNFITVNILLQALEKAGQIELGQDIYEEALRDRIVKPTKRRVDNDGTIQRMLVRNVSVFGVFEQICPHNSGLSLFRIYTNSVHQWQKLLLGAS